MNTLLKTYLFKEAGWKLALSLLGVGTLALLLMLLSLHAAAESTAMSSYDQAQSLLAEALPAVGMRIKELDSLQRDALLKLYQEQMQQALWREDFVRYHFFDGLSQFIEAQQHSFD